MDTPPPPAVKRTSIRQRIRSYISFTKIFWYVFGFVTCFVLLIILSLFIGEDVSAPAVSPDAATTGERAQFYDTTPRLLVSGAEDGYGSGGVIALSATAEPALFISGNNLNESATVALYRADEKVLLDYLVHDKEGMQIKKVPDLSALQPVTSLTQAIRDKGTAVSKVVLPLEKSGIWFVRVTVGDQEETAFIVRSNIGALVKEADNEYLFWGQDFTTHRSIPSGTVTVYNVQDTVRSIANSSFTSDGIAKTSLSADAHIALVHSGDDMALIPINLRYLNTSNEYTPFHPKQKETTLFTFTDRPLYKPGDTVYFKSVLRDDDDVRYTVPTGTASVKISKGYGQDEEVLYEHQAPISADGTVTGQYTLPADGVVGYYSLEVSLPSTATRSFYEGGGYYRTSSIDFDVENFRKPEYFIDVTAPETELIAGTASSFTIDGQYFFGQPLAGQKVKYTINSTDFYDYEYSIDRQSQSQVSDEFRYGYGGGSKEGEVVLDATGKAQVELPTQTSDTGKSKILSIEATFDDGSGNPTFSRKNVLVHAGEFGIYRTDQAYSSSVNTAFNLPVTLVPRRDISVSAVPLTATIKRVSWVQYQEADKKYPSYRQEEEDIPSVTATTNEKGEATLSFTPTKNGSYQITVAGHDKLKNQIKNEFSVWITDKDQPLYTGGDDNNLIVQTDKSHYAPTDTALVTITSNTVADRDVLLSLERARVNRFQVVHLNGKTGTAQVPLVATDIPNIFARASSFSNQSLDTGDAEITLSTDSKKLHVTLTPNKTTYAPGEDVTLNVQTTDLAGNALSADAAVWAVDKALFELSDVSTGKIFDRFWRERYNATQTAHSLEGISNSGAEGGGGGGDEARMVFKDTAYWNPSVHTDATGRAQVHFALPDNLTTWRLSALGATRDTKVGQTTSDIVVTKDVVIRPFLPNILREGDVVVLEALAQNFTNTDQVVDVGLEFTTGEIQTAPHAQVVLKAHENKKISWRLSATTATPAARFVFSITSENDGKLLDSVTQELPVIAFGFHEKRTETGTGSKDFSIQLSPDADKQKTTISLSLSSSALGTLPEAMRYLINYPYGCVEQTTSRLVPALIAKQYPTLFKEAVADKNIDEMIATGVNRLTQLQKGDGGWSWWFQGDSDPFVTAYVLEYLTQAQQAGVVVPKATIGNAQAYFENYETNGPEYRPSATPEESRMRSVIQAYALSVIGSEKGRVLITDFQGLSADMLSMAVMANIKNGNNDPATNGMAVLLAQAKKRGEGAYWESGDKKNFGSTDASTAFAMRAILAGNGDKNVLAGAARFLAVSRSHEYWSNTFATAQVMQALAEFAQKTQEATPNYAYGVTLNGSGIGSETVTSNNHILPDIMINPASLLAGGSTVSLKQTGSGPLYSTLLIDEFHTDRHAPAVDNGLTIRREYVSDKGAGKSLTIGDTVTVNLIVSGAKEDEYYAVIDDKLPAGLIPINTGLKNEQYSQTTQQPYFDSTDQEVQTDGVRLYPYRLQPGEHAYSYKARVVSEGTFIVPPATVELMYAPEVTGRSNVETITTTRESVNRGPQATVTTSPASIKTSAQGKYVALAVLAVAALVVAKGFWVKRDR